MIYTVTFNPSLDYIVRINNFQTGRVNRTSGEQILPGGKGINVSILLKNLGVDNTALGFLVGFTGKEIEKRIREFGCGTDFTWLPAGYSRINLKLKAMEESEINGQGPDIPGEALDNLYEKLHKLTGGDILVLAGSIPASLPDSVYQQIMEKLADKGLKIVVDASGNLLVNVLKYRPFLIKPNQHELAEIFGIGLTTEKEFVRYGQKLQERGARKFPWRETAPSCWPKAGKYLNVRLLTDILIIGMVYAENELHLTFIKGGKAKIVLKKEGNMKITDLLAEESINLEGNPGNKTEAIEQIVDLMAASGKLKDKEAYKKGVLEREAEGTTGVGGGVAIPHCRSESVKRPGLAAMVVKNGVDFDALDKEPVKLIFLIAAPNTEDNVHLRVLSKLAGLLTDSDFAQDLIKADGREAFLHVVERAEQAKDSKERQEAQKKAEGKEKSENEAKGLKLLAVTACPTGIAHTYMAAENIEKRAKEAGHRIKVETRGSGGAKNVLTSREIAEADCIIVAADVQVPMERFHGKKVIQCRVSDGIGKAAELIKKAESGEIPIYISHKAGRGSDSAADNFSTEKESAGRQIYKYLMNGVSHMLPFVVGGGILIALAFLIDGFSVDLLSLEDKSTFGTIKPLAAIFKTIGDTAFSFMLPILAGFIAMSIADRPGLALGFVGGAIATNGKSGFLGALAAGFLAGYTILLLKKLTAKLPEKLDGIKPILIYPLFGILITGVVITYVIEPVFGGINTALNNGLGSMGNTSSILIGLILGGMMAVDLGGPVNKAAYVFGTASIAAGNYDIMAAVMVGGMVPPCAVALATILYKNKFTAEERKSGPMNFIMGLSFISEGAIPYAAADPLHVLPALIVGSAVAGGLSMAFRCTLMAPHGGIFVFPVVGNAFLYILALAAGTAVSAVLLGILKKTVGADEK